MRRFTVSAAALLLLHAARAAAGPTAVLATAPIAGDPEAGEHVVCLVSNVGNTVALFDIVAAGTFAMEVLTSSDPEIGPPLGPGSFNAYDTAQYAEYCKLQGRAPCCGPFVSRRASRRRAGRFRVASR
jgi:hypothetical protein